ncbi:hypothetical protein C8R48DRAFT_776246 [Suillus tomentosus]|nr:hypothetical protein C8R48DRAFT_776246 [Suillus tomentosus]
MITILKHTLHRTLRSPDFRVAKPSPSPHQTAEAIPDALIMESKTTEIEEIVSEPPHTIEDAVPNPAANIPPNPVPLIDEVLSDSLSCVGRGTVCYLARKDEEEYIVKDHWVLGSKSEVLNKICMMEKMDGICGVPRLVEYWLVEMEPGEVDKIVKYFQKVPHSIKGTSQFLTSILDIIKIQKQAVEQNWVLHRDCSLNNAMIEDDGDGTHGMLIDWEFAVEIVRGDQYGVGGTGTVPFMSQSLLFQLYLHTPDPSDERLGTRASGSKPYPPPMVTHVYQDDLESMFYIFILVCIKFRGPLGMKHVLPTILPQYSLQRIKWIMQEWSASTYQKCGDSKTQFFHQSEHYTKELSRQFDPYFKSLLPLALEWYDLIKNPDRLLFNNVIDLLGRHIAALLKEDSAGLLVSKWVILSAAGSLMPPRNDEESASPPVDETRQKRVVDHRWTMEAIPKPKRNKTE